MLNKNQLLDFAELINSFQNYRQDFDVQRLSISGEYITELNKKTYKLTIGYFGKASISTDVFSAKNKKDAIKKAIKFYE